jgi:hypothetical protein
LQEAIEYKVLFSSVYLLFSELSDGTFDAIQFILSARRDEFVENGTQGFKKKPDDSKLAHAERRIGQLEMELDLVKKKNALVVKLKR